MSDQMLASISEHRLALKCECGHTGTIPVLDCMDTFGLRAPIREVVANTRCGNCTKYGAMAFEIINADCDGSDPVLAESA